MSTGFVTNQPLPPKDLPVQEERLTGKGRCRDRPGHFSVFSGEGQQDCHQGPVGMDPERGAQHMDRREKTPWEENPTRTKALRPAICSVWPGDGQRTLAWQRRLFLFGTPRNWGGGDVLEFLNPSACVSLFLPFRHPPPWGGGF